MFNGNQIKILQKCICELECIQRKQEEEIRELKRNQDRPISLKTGNLVECFNSYYGFSMVDETKELNPLQLGELLQDICEKVGLEISYVKSSHSHFKIDKKNNDQKSKR